MRNYVVSIYLLFGLFIVMGCTTASDKTAFMQTYLAPEIESQWIRDGEPILFGKDVWYPADDIESFRDDEMLKVGEYKGVDVFVDKVDIKPYARLYTKFSRNKFRYFLKKYND